MRTPVEMLAAVERGEAVNAVARRFEVTPQGLRKVRTCGDPTPLKPGPRKPTMLTPQDE